MTTNINANLLASGSDELERCAIDTGTRVLHYLRTAYGNVKGVAVRV